MHSRYRLFMAAELLCQWQANEWGCDSLKGVLLFRGTGVVCEVDSWRSLCESLLGFALIFFAFLLLLAEAIFQDNRSDHLKNCHGEDFHSYIKLPAFSVTSLPNISPACQSQLRVVLMSRDWNWWLVWRWKKIWCFHVYMQSGTMLCSTLWENSKQWWDVYRTATDTKGEKTKLKQHNSLI